MNDLRLTLIGPMPPPLNGQSVAMAHMVSALRRHFPHATVVDSSAGHIRRGTFMAWKSLYFSDIVYIAVKAGRGMWLTTLAAAASRIAGAQVVLHHHSYDYIRTRRRRMVALVRAAGPRSRHIALSEVMADDLCKTMPEIRDCVVLGNACLIDAELLDTPVKESQAEIVLGHLSNLTAGKGIAEVIDLAVALRRLRGDIRLIVAGPVSDSESQLQIDRATRELGDIFDYRGALAGDAKRQFFTDISHFVFPTDYAHEAVPLVLYEAMAAGVVCVATRRGAIPEQLAGCPALLADDQRTFVEQVVAPLERSATSRDVSRTCKDSYRKALSESEAQMTSLIASLRLRR